MDPLWADVSTSVAEWNDTDMEAGGEDEEGAAPRSLLSLASLTRERAGAEFAGAGLVQRSAIKTDRTGRAYAAMTVVCADGGQVEARWWRFPHAADQCPAEGSVWRLWGQVDSYQGVLQLRVNSGEPASDVDVTLFARAARRPVGELQAELAALIAETGDELGPLVSAVLSGETYERFCEWPAAQSHHGKVRHGLLAHSVRVARLAQRLAAGYGPGGLAHDSELVIAAALLHDVGKVWTLPRIAGGPIPEEARELDHVTRGVLVTRAAAEQLAKPMAEDRLAGLLHAILAHHGQREWGAPVEPHSVEAWLVHLADLAEARLWEWSEEA